MSGNICPPAGEMLSAWTTVVGGQATVGGAGRKVGFTRRRWYKVIYTTLECQILTERNEKLRQEFRRITENNPKLKLEKCDFLRREVFHLGHVISGRDKTWPIKGYGSSEISGISESGTAEGFMWFMSYY
jgi:hypothetical protein